MKIFFTLIALLGFMLPAYGQSSDQLSDVKMFREGRDRDFRNPQLSPLRPEDFAGFTGLKYFPIDMNYSVKAAFTPTPDEKAFMMPTSTSRLVKYLKIGVVSFTLNGQELKLGAYRRQYENPNFRSNDDSLFVPFKDLTNGQETYAAGRYLYFGTPKEKEFVLNFNLAFNPSCAYGNEEFSCTLTPKENFLKIEIKAGEKVYK